jgi:hypothetical protein
MAQMCKMHYCRDKIFCFFGKFMNETPPLVRLDLRAPLFYTEAPELDAFNCPPPGEAGIEFLFCFELDQEQSQRIDPQPEKFLGRLVFSGKNVQNQQQGNRAYNVSLELPAGLYLFIQRRGVIGREEFISLAIEQQKDGLWEKIKPGNRLFLRLLYEDGSPVTQLFRPYY